MKYEDIENVNKQIKTMGIERKDKKTGKVTTKQYAEVNQRVKAFRMLFPEGCIKTDILEMGDGLVTIKASVYEYYDGEDSYKLLATGTANEDRESSYINNNSYIENCETSAIGRALGMLGIGIDSAIASVEEITQKQKAEEKQKIDKLGIIKNLMSAKNILPNEPVEHFGKSSSDMDLEELEEVVDWLSNK